MRSKEMDVGEKEKGWGEVYSRGMRVCNDGVLGLFANLGEIEKREREVCLLALFTQWVSAKIDP